jgi:amidophosphoribosyltransferase
VSDKTTCSVGGRVLLSLSLIFSPHSFDSDVRAGEAIFLDMNTGNCHTRMCVDDAVPTPCIFEYVYFARPDSIMDGVSVYESRLRMGESLAAKIKRVYPDHGIDVVIPIPDTSRTSALQAAYYLDRPFREGFIKNRYIARTFIMPGQACRKKSVRLKLNTIKSEFAGKNVLLVDDSIVRGTTANEIVQMARDAGAKKVFFSSAAPPIRYPNIYGIDIPTREELIAYERNEEEIAAKIGCDWVVYQDLKDLEEAVLKAATPESPVHGKNFEILVFVQRSFVRSISSKHPSRIKLFPASINHSLRHELFQRGICHWGEDWRCILYMAI